MNWEKSLKIKVSLLSYLLVSSQCWGFSENHLAWQRAWVELNATDAKKVYSNPAKDGGFWLMTSNALYRVHQDQRSSLILHKKVSHIYQDLDQPESALIASEDGLYTYHDYHLSKILSHRDCLSVVKVGAKIFVGTTTGLLVGDLTKNIWHSASGILGQKPVNFLASYGDVIYVTTPNSLYRFDPNTNDYREIYSSGLTKEGEIQEATSQDEQSDVAPEILDVDISDDGSIYVSTRNGIFMAQVSGQKWNKLPDHGLPLRNLNSISVDRGQSHIWAATTQGAYRLMDQRWERYNSGLETNVIHDVSYDAQGHIYVATNRGFFYLNESKMMLGSAYPSGNRSSPLMFKSFDEIEQYFQNEPTILQVQEMAINYADVHPDKIQRWHRQSRLKAFVPSVSTGLDRSATDLMHWDTGPNPDVLSKGRDFIDWDVSVSWDLGDMVWSSDQTSIDSRSKLMVELREEVLDQVTRIYFERRRVQLSIMERKQDGEPVLEDELRLAELTAILDGFTGGKFSDRIDRWKGMS